MSRIKHHRERERERERERKFTRRKREGERMWQNNLSKQDEKGNREK